MCVQANSISRPAWYFEGSKAKPLKIAERILDKDSRTMFRLMVCPLLEPHDVKMRPPKVP